MASDTPNTPLQPPNDDRVLLRQLFALVQDLSGDLRSANARLVALEEKANRTTPDMMAAFSEVLRIELEPLRVEIRDLRHAFRSTYIDMVHAQRDLEERISRLERRPPE